MLPGGFDHVLEGNTSPWALDLLLRGLRTLWPLGVVVEDETEVALHKLSFPFLREEAEVLVYQIPGSSTYLHLIKRNCDLTIVSDEACRELAQELLSAVRFNGFCWRGH